MIFAFRVPLLGRKIALRQVKALPGAFQNESQGFVAVDRIRKAATEEVLVVALLFFASKVLKCLGAPEA
jgi:hypothetical protein